LKGLPPMPTPEALLLRTERLDLIPITREHAAPMFPVLNDPALYTFTGGSPPSGIAALARTYEFWEARRSPDGAELWFNWAVRLRAEGELVGHMQAGLTSAHAYMAWTLGSRWQHRGYATEASRAVLDRLLGLGAREIRASIHPGHIASIRVAERLGLERTSEPSGKELIWKLIVQEAPPTR
jgi:RimJ/RimL family protein N-acetyltransferase